jgi:hypothetical protein
MSCHGPCYQDYKKYEQIIIIVSNGELEKQLYKFFKEYNISRTNKEILKDYLDIFRIEKDVIPITIRNNAIILISILKNIDEDLNTLSKESVKKYKIAVNNHKNEKNGKPASTSTKKMYRTGFAQFLRWEAKEYNKPEYIEFAEDLKFKVKTEGKNPNDLLTKEEIDRMINVAARGRDQAILQR